MDQKQPKDQPDLGTEFRDLGENLKNIFHSTWESEEARRFRDELRAGLNELGRSMNETASEFRTSESGQRLRKETEEIKERFQSGEFESKARSELHKALKMINTELQNVLNNWPEEKDNNEEV